MQSTTAAEILVSIILTPIALFVAKQYWHEYPIFPWTLALAWAWAIYKLVSYCWTEEPDL